jgi:hypothetical protein
MKRKVSGLFLSVIFCCAIPLFSQTAKDLTETDKRALEGIVVEKYYTASKADAADTSGGVLQEGSVTYRIYVDLKPGYNLQAVYGVSKHQMFLKTTTKFFNNREGAPSADKIMDKRINDNTVALDSWVTIGIATEKRFGILKAEDKDTSIIKRKGLDKADGLYLAGQTQKLLLFGLDLAFFENEKDASYFHSENGSWASIGGGKAQGKMKEENKILIAQLTTTGKLSFELNLQVGTPGGTTIQYVAKNPTGKEIEFKQLTRK